MKILSITIIVGVFVAAPLYMLDAFVMPALNGLQQQYRQADAVSMQAAGIR